jgi:hypothetical protein
MEPMTAVAGTGFSAAARAAAEHAARVQGSVPANVVQPARSDARISP